MKTIFSTAGQNLSPSRRSAKGFRTYEECPVRAAAAIREGLGLSGKINTVKLLSKVVDRVVWSRECIAPVSGQTIRSEDGCFVTVLNISERKWIGRMRWTRTHEALHVILGHFELEHIEDEEALCNQVDMVAAELLLPCEHVFSFVHYHTDGPGVLPAEIGRFKDRFAVSWAAAVRRLDALGIQPIEVSRTLLEWVGPEAAASIVSLQNPAHLQALQIIKRRGLQV